MVDRHRLNDSTGSGASAGPAPPNATLNVPTRTNTSLPSPNHGIFTQLQNLIPRHALFHVCIQIHQISNIPLTQGDFGVRWKIRNTTTSYTKDGTRSGVLNRLRPKKDVHQKFSAGNHSSNLTVSADGSRPSLSNTSNSFQSRSTSTSTTASSAPSIASGSAASSVTASRTSTPEPDEYYPCLLSHPGPAPPTSPPRGMTSYLPLKEHSVTWSQSLHTVVKLNVQRGSHDSEEGFLEPTNTLQGSIVKLVVMQKVVPGDPNAPRNPRLGAVYLNLAEYASVQGETTRRYLLRESKTNATLKLTVALTHIGGESDFVAPTLAKGEILSGISALLENDVYKTRPRTYDLFGSLMQNKRGTAEVDLTMGNHGLLDTSDDEHTASETERSKRTRPPSRQSISSTHSGHSYQLSSEAQPARKHGRRRPPPIKAHSSLSPILASPPLKTSISALKSSTGEMPFDVSQLPYAYGPKTTETLIDAIFNPVPVSAKSIEHIAPVGKDGKKPPGTSMLVENNPFVYYVPDPVEIQSFQTLLHQNFAVSPDKDKTIGRGAPWPAIPSSKSDTPNGATKGHLNGASAVNSAQAVPTTKKGSQDSSLQSLLMNSMQAVSATASPGTSISISRPPSRPPTRNGFRPPVPLKRSTTDSTTTAGTSVAGSLGYASSVYSTSTTSTGNSMSGNRTTSGASSSILSSDGSGSSSGHSHGPVTARPTSSGGRRSIDSHGSGEHRKPFAWMRWKNTADVHHVPVGKQSLDIPTPVAGVAH